MPTAQRCVLVIEDEPLIRMATVEALEPTGCRVFEASTLKEAREMLATREFAVVISDVNLPDGTATQFLLDIRAGYPEMRVILTTGSSTPEELKSGAISVLTKPFSDQALRDLQKT